MHHPTSGTPLLDDLLDGLRIGDNVVLVGDEDAPLDRLVARFTERVPDAVPRVLVTVGRPWTTVVPSGTLVLDWSAPATGAASPFPDALPVEASLETALETLRTADERVGTGAAFVFDRLAAVQDVWGPDAALELFLTACPRLYRRRSLAVWPVDRARHRPTFLRRLTEITQVVVEVIREHDHFRATVRKADGRDATVTGRSVTAEVVGDELVATAEPTNTRAQLGGLVRDQRLANGLPQAELARRVGITPSALSQVERGVRGPSGDTLIRLWEVLGVPFGPVTGTERGYRVERRSGRDRARLQEGMIGERLLADSDAGQLWRLELSPGASGDRAPFDTKATEIVTVTRGVVDLRVGGRSETLHEGDAFVSASTPVSGWSNPGTETAELLWIVQGP